MSKKIFVAKRGNFGHGLRVQQRIERSILFTGPMVLAIFDGRKTQTRRVIKFQEHACLTGDCPHDKQAQCDAELLCECPYGQPGDRLWVRETFLYRPEKTSVRFRADLGSLEAHIIGEVNGGWKPAIHMPRWASRLMLEIVSVRVERVQNITESGAKLEGAPDGGGIDTTTGSHYCSFRDGFQWLWDSINSERGYRWEHNPWVWVIEFRRL